MSDSKNSLGTVLLLVVTVGLVGAAAWDQLGRHLPKSAAPEAAVAQGALEDLPDAAGADSAAAGLPVFIEADSVGRPGQDVRPNAGTPADSGAVPAGMPPGETLTI